MRIVAHLSDLHFGRIDHALVEPLRQAVIAARPDVVAVSGDLTQRARQAQFAAAREFLDSLPGPLIVVPGNHDVPLHNLVARFARPLAHYRRHITGELAPFYADDEIALAGVNTARSLTIQGGRINRAQVEQACRRLSPLPRHIMRIVVSHHPFELPPGRYPAARAGRARMAMRELAGCGADIYLSGHLHLAWTAVSAGAALFIQAGTAFSTRTRGERPSFNVIRIEPDTVRVACWIAHSFYTAATVGTFERREGRWQPTPPSTLHQS